MVMKGKKMTKKKKKDIKGWNRNTSEARKIDQNSHRL